MMQRMRRRALKENRMDDADDKVIRHRFEVYHKETHPVLEYYPPSTVVNIDAVGSPAQVFMRVLDVVVPVQDAHFNQPAVAAT
jgi:adenylate kinase